MVTDGAGIDVDAAVTVLPAWTATFTCVWWKRPGKRTPANVTFGRSVGMRHDHVYPHHLVVDPYGASPASPADQIDPGGRNDHCVQRLR